MTAAAPAPAVSSLWRRTPPPWLVDVLVPFFLELPTIGSLLHDGETRWWVWLLAELLVVPLVARRRYPVAVFGLLAVAALVQWAADVRFVADLALLVALYTVAAHRDRRTAITAAAVLEVGVVLASIRFAPTGGGIVGSLVFLSGLVTAALFVGTTLQTRRDYLASLEDRAQRLERERDQQAQLAVTAERTRIAREMHDIIAHSLSVIITLADGAALASEEDAAEARQAMTQVAGTGRQALTEMRRLLGVLRAQSPAELAPQPTLDRLDALINDTRTAGLPVRLVVSGAPQLLPRTAEATIYRVVQESLTNVLKHATHPSRVTVTLRWAPEEVEVEVADDGDPVSAATANGRAQGHGLQGMRERVALFDGRLVAGPRVPRGWEVRASLRTDGDVA